MPILFPPFFTAVIRPQRVQVLLLDAIERGAVRVHFLKFDVIFLTDDVLYALMADERNVRADAQEPGREVHRVSDKICFTVERFDFENLAGGDAYTKTVGLRKTGDR
jgi:hypothetical protein